MTTRIWKFTVGPAEESLRLDQLISQRTGLSRRKARAVLQMGGVQVARKRVRVAGRTLAAGAEVLVAHDDALGVPPDLPVPVLFEDDWLLVVDKPAGMASQGTQASDQHDLTALLQRQRPGQVLALQHRLDQGTSGILVIAKHASAHLGSQFQARTIAKTYLARARRAPGPGQRGPAHRPHPGLPTGPLRLFGRPGGPAAGAHRFPPGRAEEAVGLCPGFWVVAEPHTGRTHQIRVHLSHLGRPVVGDGYYHGEPSDQLWLHAWKLELEHPVTGARLALTAPPTRFMAIHDGPGASAGLQPGIGASEVDVDGSWPGCPGRTASGSGPVMLEPPFDYAPWIDQARRAGGPLLVWGGDGTFHHAGRALVAQGGPVALGAVPGGSGNGLVRGLRTPWTPPARSCACWRAANWPSTCPGWTANPS